MRFCMKRVMLMNVKTNWIQNIVETAVQNYNNRTIVLWGKYSVSDEIKEQLKEYGITDVIYVDQDTEKQDASEVFSAEIINGNVEHYYIVIPIGVYDAIRTKLTEEKYKQITDYYYFSDCVMKKSEEYYEDAHRNKMIGNRSGLKFVFSGWDSEIRIGNDVSIENLQLYMHNDMHVRIGNGVKGKFKKLSMENRSFLEIGDEVIIDGIQIELGENSSLKIGNHAAIGGGI